MHSLLHHLHRPCPLPMRILDVLAHFREHARNHSQEILERFYICRCSCSRKLWTQPIGHALFLCAFLQSLLVSTSGGCLTQVKLLHFTIDVRSPSLSIRYSITCIGHALFLCTFLMYLLVYASTHETIHKRSWNSFEWLLHLPVQLLSSTLDSAYGL
jgi:hypothetical protein